MITASAVKSAATAPTALGESGLSKGRDGNASGVAVP